MTVATIGMDIAKNVFQVYGADASGHQLFNRKLARSAVLNFFQKLPPCIVAMESCSTAHHWGRSILALGHEVRLIHPTYVKPFVHRDKTDANDAEAIHEALFRKSMRFVPLKSTSHQGSIMLFKTRALLVRQRVRAVNALRAHLAELGIVAQPGASNVSSLISIVRDQKNKTLPPSAKMALKIIAKQIDTLSKDIEGLERTLKSQAKMDDEMRRLMTIPGVGPMTATAIKAFVTDIKIFKSARHFASWTGLTPKSFSSGESIRIGGITKMGNPDLRSLLVAGAMSVIRNTKTDDTKSWTASLKRRRPFKVAAIALANKTARTIWAILSKGGSYEAARGRTSAATG